MGNEDGERDGEKEQVITRKQMTAAVTGDG